MAKGWTVEASAYFHGIKHQIPLSTGRDEGDQHFAKLSFTCVHFHACPSGAGRPPVGTSEGHELGCSAQLEGPAGPERRPTHTQHGPGPAGSGDARLGGRGVGGRTDSHPKSVLQSWRPPSFGPTDAGRKPGSPVSGHSHRPTGLPGPPTHAPPAPHRRRAAPPRSLDAGA